ncbi:Mesaconyl-C(4)-CoA hydratase [Paramyrothecium foliicola]|nr:Mesaconyl-C(4)-CoA hydratase [Paramyrothecium foliicola]
MRPCNTTPFAVTLRAIRRGLNARFAGSVASEAAKQLVIQFQGQVTSRKQVLDGNQLQKLSLTLNRPELHPGLDISKIAPANGTALPPGYHLVYFTPGGLEKDLGTDGTDRSFNAPAPFTRRMWAGGRMQWIKERPLRVGEQVEEHTSLVSAEPKKSRNGDEMVVVTVEKEFWGSQGLSLVDQRSWIFRPELSDSVEGGPISTPLVTMPTRAETVLQPLASLTFNAHRIHYDATWSQGVEKHTGLVVHGPLNLINMLDYWRDVHGVDGAVPSDISYRAMSPLYSGELYSIKSCASEKLGGGYEVLVEKDGTLCMRGEINQA